MDFSAEFFSGNRQRLLEASEADLIVLTANGLLQRNADITFPFRQDSNFWYLSGIEEPDYILVFNRTDSFLIAPPRAEHRDVWDGAIDTKKLMSQSGIAELLDHHGGWNRLDRLLKKIKKVHTVTPAEPYFDRFGFYANPARGALLAALKKHRSLELVDVRKPIARLRQVKQPVEVVALQRAVDITATTLTDIKPKLATYQFEYELVADITGSFLRQGAKGHAYEPIVAGGVNAATIHHMKYDSAIPQNSLILFDIGAEVSNYGADISRTFALGTPSQRAVEIHGAVSRVQKAAFGLLKPGVLHKEYEQQVDEIMAEELHGLGLLKDKTDKKAFRKLYPHLTSHFLGLDTHDAADYELPLAENMVLTVEPGIYIASEGIGVRIEDDVIITKTGCRNLSAGLPSHLN
jgi:Xaa-Pro aminopeptidase